jgi:glutathione S-transferase
MKNEYKYYGWQASLFAGKIRGYLNYKGVDYVEKNINIFDILVKIPKHTGRSAMPALETKQGEWFCDTPLIMEELERRHPTPRVLANGSVQNFVAELFQNWVDDVWVPVALHSRWSYSENYEKVNREEGAKSLLPFAPRFIRNKISDKAFRDKMKQHMPNMGVIPEQIDLFEAWTCNLLDLFETHFSEYSYLLGERPTVADFGLLGPMLGHLNRDPWPKREWLDPRPNLQAWVEKMGRGDMAKADLLAEDEIPKTLMPIIEVIFSEYIPFMKNTTEEISKIIQMNQLKSGDELPRSTPRINMNMMDGQFKRASFTYSVWRMQRLQKMVRDYSQAYKGRLETWLSEQGQPDFLSHDFGVALKRHALVAALA